MRKLTYNALQYMDGAKVLVKDLEYDAYDQVCEVKVEYGIVQNKKKLKTFPSRIILENEEFKYVYENGLCNNGQFEVYNYEQC